MSGWALVAFMLCTLQPGQEEPICDTYPWQGDEAPPTVDTQEQCGLQMRFAGKMAFDALELPDGSQWMVQGICVHLDEDGNPSEGGGPVKGTSA